AARESRVGPAEVYTARVVVRVREGVFHVDTADARVSGVELHARGTLAAEEGGPAGELVVGFAADSLERLRPLLVELDGPVAEELTELEREVLRAEGVDPGDLPAAEDVALA